MNKKIVTIGGGTGSFMLLSELKKHKDVEITAVVTMSDSGGSTGILRDELGVLPSGDVRQALIALSNSSDILRDLFLYRFSEGGLGGHNLGNIFLSALEKITGSFEEAVTQASEILGVTGSIIPATLADVQLFLEKEDGEVIFGEGSIDNAVIQPYKKLLLSKNIEANPKAISAIMDADIVIVNPGNFFCSILPNLLIPGIREALSDSSAKKIYVANLMTKPGHTDDFTVSTFIEYLHRYGKDNFLTHVLCNTNQEINDKELLEKYKESGEVFVPFGDLESHEVEVITADLLSGTIERQKASDVVKRSLIRHDAEKLINLILSI